MLTEALEKLVQAGEIAGCAAGTWRDGTLTVHCAGWRNKEASLRVEPDTIFRIASMSKPVVSVAALMLVEEGKISLDEPIANAAPEFANMRVLNSPDGPLDQTVPAARPITFEDLLTHRAGFTYGDFHRGPIAQAYRDALGGDIDSDVKPTQWIPALARLPLIAQPGAVMFYGRSTDLLGLLLARIEGARLGDVLKRRIFDPLGMADTGFLVPTAKWPRRSAAYGFDAAGTLTKRTMFGGGAVVPERPEDMEYESGGQGLWSTLPDYIKFARLFLGGGAVDGVRLLRPETIAKMSTNHLTDQQRANSVLLGRRLFAKGRGFGLGVAVVLESDPNDLMRRGHPGSVGWPGAYGGWWQADPVDGSAAVFLAHNMVDLDQMSRGLGLGVWAALEVFQRLATS